MFSACCGPGFWHQWRIESWLKGHQRLQICGSQARYGYQSALLGVFFPLRGSMALGCCNTPPSHAPATCLACPPSLLVTFFCPGRCSLIHILTPIPRISPCTMRNLPLPISGNRSHGAPRKQLPEIGGLGLRASWYMGVFVGCVGGRSIPSTNQVFNFLAKLLKIVVT